MATGAVDRHRGAGGHDLREHVIKIQGPRSATQDRAFGLHLADKIPRAGSEKAGGDNCIPVIRPKGITGDLFLQEPVIRLVGIEGLDDVVAVGPGVGAQFIARKAVRVGVVGDIQPVPGESLAVVGRGQKCIDQIFVGLGIRAVDKRLHRLWLGRQAKQIKIQAANKGAAIRLRRRLELPFLKPAQDKGVNRVSHHRR